MIEFGALTDLIKRVLSLKRDEALLFSLSNEQLQNKLLLLNTDDQLFRKGINSKGVRLEKIGGPYSEYTIERKIEDGLPFDHITLFQEGEFYESFTFEAKKGYYLIDADPIKEGGENLFNRWGIDVLGLTDQNQEKINAEIIPGVQDFFLKKIQGEI